MKNNEMVHQPETEIQELQSNSPHSLISQALAQGAPIEQMEKLMDLQERWEKKEAKKVYLKAFAKFQSLCPLLYKEKTVDYTSKQGGQVKYDYSTLGYIAKKILPSLKKCGLSYRWEFEENDKIKCTCILSHVDGHSEKSTMEAGKDMSGKKNDIQAIGSTRQYLQRYTLVSVGGLTTADKDDDGQSSKSESNKTEEIPEPEEKLNWTDMIKGCETKKQLEAIFNKMSTGLILFS